MGRQAGLFDIEERLGDLSAKGDDLERINALVDFEAFRLELERAVPRSDRVPDANSIWNFREALTWTTRDGLPAIEGCSGVSTRNSAPPASSPWAWVLVATPSDWAKSTATSAVCSSCCRTKASISAIFRSPPDQRSI